MASFSKNETRRISIQSDQYLPNGTHQADRNYFTNTENRVGEFDPKYKQNILNGQNATHSLTANFDSVKITEGYMDFQMFWKNPLGLPAPVVTASVTNAFRQIDPFVLGVQADMTRAVNQASVAIRQKIRSTKTQLSGPTFVGEIRETLHLIRHPAFALQSLVSRHLIDVQNRLYLGRRNNRSRLVRSGDVRRSLADSWLEFSFGAAPLLSDIRDGAIALARLHEKPRSTVLSAQGVDEKFHTNSRTAGVASSYLAFQKNTFEKSKCSCFYHVGMKASTNAPVDSYTRLKELSGFTLSEFFPTVWELLPWSFLADYFSNIGDVISAACVDTSSVTWVSRSRVTDRTQQVSIQPDVARTAALCGRYFVSASTGPGGSYKRLERKITRDSELTVPTLQLEIPGLNSKWINMGALILSGRNLEKTLRGLL